MGGFLGRKDASDLVAMANEDYDDEVFVTSDWIKMRNFGNLHIPTVELEKDIMEMDKDFFNFHQDCPGLFKPFDLSRIEGVIRKFFELLKTKYLVKYPSGLLHR